MTNEHDVIWDSSFKKGFCTVESNALESIHNPNLYDPAAVDLKPYKGSFLSSLITPEQPLNPSSHPGE